MIGDRWTLLIVRELLAAPKRYSELRAGLPGVASNLLADRLRDLAAAGLVEHDDRYALTERGRALDDVLQSLFRWGVPLMATGQGDDTFDPQWLAGALRRVYAGASSEQPIRIEARSGDGIATISIGPTGPAVLPQPAIDPDARIAGPPDHVLGVLSGLLDPSDAEVVITGDVSTLERALAARNTATRP